MLNIKTVRIKILGSEVVKKHSKFLKEKELKFLNQVFMIEILIKDIEGEKRG